MTTGTNPLRGPNRLKLGVFNINGDGNSRTLVPLDVAKQLKRKYTAAGTGTLLCGDAKGLADQLEQISAAGVDGVLLTWVDFQTGIRRFGTEILPILEARKLRHPA